MSKKRNNIFLSIISSFLILAISATFIVYNKSNFSILETSILTMLKAVYQQNVEPPDLGIENITVRKVADPTEKFNYYKYNATIVLKNYGGNLINGKLALRGYPDQKNVMLNNDLEGFTLYADRSFIIRDYEIILDANYNGGEFSIEIDLIDETDYYKDNNVYRVSVFEMPAKIESISLKEIEDDGDFLVDFDADRFSLRKHDFEVYVGEDMQVDEESLRYDEVFTQNDLFGYHRFRNSEENLQGSYEVFPTTETTAHHIDFGTNPFYGTGYKYIFVKAINPKTGYYAISNVLRFGPQEEMSRIEFVRNFIDTARIEIDDAGDTHYSDIAEGEWYSSYIETLYNLGLLDITNEYFGPEKTITRAEVLKTVLDYYDVDLAVVTDGESFEDVDPENEIHPYTEAYAVSSGRDLADGHFYPEYYRTEEYST